MVRNQSQFFLLVTTLLNFVRQSVSQQMALEMWILVLMRQSWILDGSRWKICDGVGSLNLDSTLQQEKNKFKPTKDSQCNTAKAQFVNPLTANDVEAEPKVPEASTDSPQDVNKRLCQSSAESTSEVHDIPAVCWLGCSKELSVCLSDRPDFCLHKLSFPDEIGFDSFAPSVFVSTLFVRAAVQFCTRTTELETPCL